MHYSKNSPSVERLKDLLPNGFCTREENKDFKNISSLPILMGLNWIVFKSVRRFPLDIKVIPNSYAFSMLHHL